MSAMSKPRPVSINLHQASRVLEVKFDDGSQFNLDCEYLRVYSPSAEVRGHGPGQEVLQVGKQNVNISNIEAVGNYAVRLLFDDGHDTGIYSFEYLYELGVKHESNMADYHKRLQDSGHDVSQPTNGSHAGHAPGRGGGTVVKI